MAKRPLQMPYRAPLAHVEIQVATYVGSPEHKAHKWWGGLPQAYIGMSGKADRPKKQMTTICPLTQESERKMATGWVIAALSLGQYQFYEGDKTYPKKIWYRDQDGQFWFGLCLNGIQGQYKGWPVEEEEKIAIFG